MISKYTSIKYPFFGIKRKPEQISFENNKIYIVLDGIRYLADDWSMNKPSYLERLLEIDRQQLQRLKFKYTINSIQQFLLTRKVKWGIDITGKPYDISYQEQHPIKEVTVERIKNNYVWFKGVSYPFELKYGLNQLIHKYLIITLINIAKVWYIFDFKYQYTGKKYALC